MGMKVIAVLRLCVWAATALQGRLVRDYTFLSSVRAAATACAIFCVTRAREFTRSHASGRMLFAPARVRVYSARHVKQFIIAYFRLIAPQ